MTCITYNVTTEITLITMKRWNANIIMIVKWTCEVLLKRMTPNKQWKQFERVKHNLTENVTVIKRRQRCLTLCCLKTGEINNKLFIHGLLLLDQDFCGIRLMKRRVTIIIIIIITRSCLVYFCLACYGIEMHWICIYASFPVVPTLLAWLWLHCTIL